MSQTILVLFAVALAAGLTYFQYFYKNTNQNRVTYYLTILRFLSIFGVLLLLINPIFSRKTFETIKAPLPIVIDNSSSISELKANQKALEIFNILSNNKDLNEKYEVQQYSFDNDFQSVNNETEINFKGLQTNIDNVAKNLKSNNKNRKYPTVLITDGNQTKGNDYVYSFDAGNKVFPVIVGDTTTFLDLKINQLNVNKYAFQKNKFPVEVFLQYSGNKTVNANFNISQGKNVLAKQSVTFSPSKKTAIISILLPAANVGLQIFKATISSPEKEKNIYNNSKNFAVEVIDQQTNIAIISSINHPDIGALKRAIETNKQRKVTIVKPLDIKSLTGYNVLIYYQPMQEFKQVFDNNKLAGLNSFIITGNNTDYNFLNQQQTNLTFKMSNQKEDYIASYNPQFNLFAIDNIGFENLPPLQNAFGTVTTNGDVAVLLNSKIRNIATNSPLLAFAQNQGKRNAFLLGENIWKWRFQNNIQNNSFEKFDVFIDKIIQFLATNNSKKSLIVNHESFYNSGDALEINAQFFNKNYELDEKARLTIAVTNKKTKEIKKYDLLKTNNGFKVNLDGLIAGQYSFVVKELNSNQTYNGYFEILDFDIEKQFVNPDLLKLNQLANSTNGKLYFPNQVDNLIKNLLNNDNYRAIQKEIVKKTPLIDWYWLLLLIAISLAAEWFIRKYNGMI